MSDGGAIETALASAIEHSERSQDGLPTAAAQEEFSLGFVRMVAAAARCSVKHHMTDYDGVDITIASSVEYEDCYAPQLELQVKCTTQVDLMGERNMSWRLEEKPFRKLTNPKRFLPAYIGVLVVPSEPELWLDQDDARLITKSRMYWQRAAELGAIADGAGSKTVKLPRTNLFTATQLLGIMRDIAERGDY